MLAAEHRLTSGEEFRRAVRRGRRAGSRLLVVHLAEHAPEAGPARPGAGPRVGFVVSRSVGGAVVRNRVKRRLRHLARERLASLPGSVVLVVRAQPPAAEASYQELGAALDRCLERLTRPGSGGTGRREPQEVGA